MSNTRKRMPVNVTVHKKISQFIPYHKISIFICILLAAILIYIVGGRLYSNYTTTMNAVDTANMRDRMYDIAEQLRTANAQVKWDDTSSCTVYEPRKFGDTTRFSCTSSYEANMTLHDLAEVDHTVGRYQSILVTDEKIIVSDETTPSERQGRDSSVIGASYPRSFNFNLSGVRTDKCDINYSVTDRNAEYHLKIYVRCYKNTAEAYFEPIRRI